MAGGPEGRSMSSRGNRGAGKGRESSSRSRSGFGGSVGLGG